MNELQPLRETTDPPANPIRMRPPASAATSWAMGRAARRKRERAFARHAPATPSPLRSRLGAQMGLALVLAAVLAGAAIGFIESARPSPPSATLTRVDAVARTYAGIEQRGSVLGRAGAPVTLVVYLDPQCPYCGEWERVAMPELIARYVRPGTLRIVVRGLHFLGPDSEKALRLLDAAALQDRLFQAAEILYWNQGEENTGWVSDGYLRSLAHSVPGADPQRLLADQDAPAVEAKMRADEQAATRDGVSGTPSIHLGRTGGQLRHIQPARLDAAAVAPEIQRLAEEAAR